MTVFRNALTRGWSIGLIAGLVAVPAASQTLAPQAAAVPAPVAELTAEQQLARLNAEQAAIARQQLDKNIADQRAYDDAVKAREAEIARVQAAYEAENARVKADYEAAMKKWQENAAACKARDKKRCVPLKVK